MSLVGSLEDLSLLDILQIVNVSRRTGVLNLSPPGMGAAFIHFSTGNVSDIVGEYDELAFLRFFEVQGLVEQQEINEALSKADNRPLQALHRMIQAGILSRPFVEQARRLELARRLKDLTRCDRGEFRFSLDEQGDTANLPGPVPFCPLEQPVSPQNLLTQTLTETSFPAPASRPAPPPPRPPAPGPRPAPKLPEEAVAEVVITPPPAPARRAAIPPAKPPAAPAPAPTVTAQRRSRSHGPGQEQDHRGAGVR